MFSNLVFFSMVLQVLCAFAAPVTDPGKDIYGHKAVDVPLPKLPSPSSSNGSDILGGTTLLHRKRERPDLQDGDMFYLIALKKPYSVEPSDLKKLFTERSFGERLYLSESIEDAQKLTPSDPRSAYLITLRLHLPDYHHPLRSYYFSRDEWGGIMHDFKLAPSHWKNRHIQSNPVIIGPVRQTWSYAFNEEALSYLEIISVTKVGVMGKATEKKKGKGKGEGEGEKDKEETNILGTNALGFVTLGPSAW